MEVLLSPEKFNGKSNPKETNNSTLAEEHSLSNRMRERYDGGNGIMIMMMIMVEMMLMMMMMKKK